MIDLGKWPTMRVVGDPITSDQAGDLLICTAPWFDTFPKGHGWDYEARMIGAEYGMPVQPVYRHGGDHSGWFKETWHVFRPKLDEWRKRYGVLDVMSLDGPSGDLIWTSYRAWCNWDGLVAGQFSIGKWPSEDDVADFFAEVAERFPFLRLTVDLISEDAAQRGTNLGDADYNRAYRLTVADGQVTPYEGTVQPLLLPNAWFDWQNSADRFVEQGVSPDRLRRAFEHLVHGRD